MLRSETPDARAYAVRLATHALVIRHAARVVHRRCPRALRLPWQAAQASNLAASEPTEPESSAHGLRVRDPDDTLPPANSTHYSHMGAGADMTRLTLGKSGLGEAAWPDLTVQAKAKWLSYSTTIPAYFLK